MSTPVILLGGGGHARVLIDLIELLGIQITGVTDREPEKIKESIKHVKILGDDKRVLDYPPHTIKLVNGIGSVSSMEKRREIYAAFKEKGYSFVTLIHPSAVIAGDVKMGEGVQIMAGVTIQTGCMIGSDSIINTGAVIDHECIIGDHVHVAPGAVLSGDVHLGSMVHFGTSATAIQGVRIGNNTTIGAGAVVTGDIPPGVTAWGVPAKIVEKRD